MIAKKTGLEKQFDIEFGFVLIINCGQVTSPEEEISVQYHMELNFVKLTPLIL
ncbi:hypothetical protein GCM10009122_02930 [Fulvivirga kasyanovii]